MADYKVSLQQFADELRLETVHAPCALSQIFIRSTEVSRPGLILAGFEEHFDSRRIQIIGLMEYTYLEQRSAEERYASLDRLMGHKPVVVVLTRELDVFDEMRELAVKYSVPLMRSLDKTSDFMSASIAYLNVQLAPMVLQHGELVEVFGEGILILGESGVGKSETAVELINRGHRLVADDSVELRRVSERTIVGTSPDNIRYFVELRGIGIVNVKQLFGMGAVKLSERVDFVVNLEHWVEGKNYSKIGMGDETLDILGLKIPMITIPVRPGRNLAVIVEVAAMNHRNLKLGYNAEEDLLKSLGLTDDLM
ncbi:MAG: HPr(Ser) kinase/phosphatase [Oscillospiraceae bacterium]|nr:HPr(Ser) kinase/phosphatase [Oscillospiraceae bacterium]MBQ9959708.1 HPr(Ser) kinase/phosphatase [Oscillospiraceae bacterium]